MTPQEITAIVTALGDIVKVLADAEPEDKIKIYARLVLRLTYEINANTIEAVAEPLHKENNGSEGIESQVPKYGARRVHRKLHERNSMRQIAQIKLSVDPPELADHPEHETGRRPCDQYVAASAAASITRTCLSRRRWSGRHGQQGIVYVCASASVRVFDRSIAASCPSACPVLSSECRSAGDQLNSRRWRFARLPGRNVGSVLGVGLIGIVPMPRARVGKAFPGAGASSKCCSRAPAGSVR
jgi:hypothetical protein